MFLTECGKTDTPVVMRSNPALYRKCFEDFHACPSGIDDKTITKEYISDSKKGKRRHKAVMIKIIKTGTGITYDSVSEAAKEMGVSRPTIRNLAKKKTQSECKCGKYVNLLFTARFNVSMVVDGDNGAEI
jgi:predicted XRE-type DNA-binding protein